MKANVLFARFVATLSFVAAMVFSISALQAAVQQGSATIQSMKGEVSYSTGAGAFQPAKKGQTLNAGDIIRTGTNSHATLSLGQNNGTVTLEPLSEVGIDKLTYDYTGLEVIHDTRLNLKDGAIVGKVKKVSPSSTYEVKLPRGVAAVRGTVYRFAANGDASVALGTVILSIMTPNGIQSFTIPGGNRFNGATMQMLPLTPAEQKALMQAAGGDTGPIPSGGQSIINPTPVEPFVSPVVP